MHNREIRLYAMQNNIRLYRIAERLGISDSRFSKRLRNELPEEEKQRIRQIIDELSGTESDNKPYLNVFSIEYLRSLENGSVSEELVLKSAQNMYEGAKTGDKVYAINNMTGEVIFSETKQ